MSTSRHPVALRLERVGRSDAALLALVMLLPLIDGVFPALILAGALDDPLGAIQVGLLIFGGSATVAVILAEMDGTPREQARIVLLIGAPLIALAGIQAALAPSIASVLDLVIFERFAALVIAAIAARTASARIGEYLPSAGVVVALGLVASLDPSGAEFVVLEDPRLVAHATGAAVVGVAFALSLALAGPYLRAYVDIDRFRFGSALALGILPLSMLGMACGTAPLAVLVLAGIFAFDPGEEWAPRRVGRWLTGERPTEDGGYGERAIRGGVGWQFVESDDSEDTIGGPGADGGSPGSGARPTSAKSSGDGSDGATSAGNGGGPGPDGRDVRATGDEPGADGGDGEENESAGETDAIDDRDRSEFTDREPWV